MANQPSSILSSASVNVLLLVCLAAIWGSAFSVIKIIIDDIPPVMLAASRVSIGAMALTIYVLASGRNLPRDRKTWIVCLKVGAIGIALPFSMIAWGEQHISSSMAAIGTALVPLATLVFAHFMTLDEKLTLRKLVGVITGFGGVFLLFYHPGHFQQTSAYDQIWGLGAIMIAVIGYALCVIFARRLKDEPRLGSSAGILITASVVLVPLTIILEHPWTFHPTGSVIGGLVFLGLFPTALATIVMVTLTARAGATFMSLTNYLVPVVAILLGVVWLGEDISWRALLAFLFICCGIFLTGTQLTKPGLPTMRYTQTRKNG